MPQHCPRCEATLPVIDGADATFCAACGLPQLRVSSDFLEAPERTSPQASSEAQDAPGSLDWPITFRVLSIAVLAGLIPCVLLPGAVASGAGGLLAILLLPLLCLGSGMAYVRRGRHRLSARGGARIGAALALMLAAVLAVCSGVVGFALRYGYHSRVVEASLNAAMLQSEAQMRTNAGSPLPENALALIRSPEGHAGAFLLMQCAIALMLVLAGGICGSVMGALIAARQRRSQPSS